jgi:hypothetical protein
MKVNQISAELSSDILAASDLVHDQSISESERGKKLNALKSSILEKIDAENDATSFAGRTYLEQIQKVITNEEWAKLPPPTTVKNELLAMRSLVAVLTSFEDDRSPMMEAIQRLLTEALLKHLNSLSDAEVLSLSKQWGAAEIQFQKEKASAEAERQSSLMTAGIGIGTAGLSLLAKAVVTKVSNDKFKQAAPSEKEKTDLTGAMGEQSKAEFNLNTVSKEMSEIDDELAKTRKDISKLQEGITKNEFTGPERISKQTELNEKNLALNDLQKRRDDLTPSYERLKTDYEIAAKVTERERAKVDGKNAEASKSVQEFRALLDMSDSSMSVIQNIGKVISVYLFDSKASDEKIESEKFGYLVSFFASALQNTQKSQGQAGDGLATIRSSCDATIQGADSSITYAIKA